MAWKEMFDEKFMTAEEAAKMINSGDVVHHRLLMLLQTGMKN